MKGLDEKDKELLTHLYEYCRFTNKQLSKVLNLPRQTVDYRIKRLESRGYISRYDAILNFDNIPLVKKIYFFNTENPKEIINKVKKETSVFGIIENTGTYSLSVWCFFKDKKQMKSFESGLGFSDSLEIDHNIESEFNKYGKKVKLKAPSIEENQIKLDKKDVKLMKHLAAGHARDSIPEIADKLNVSYESAYYRLNQLVKNGYFSKLIPQHGERLGGLHMTLFVFELKKPVSQKLVKEIEDFDYFVVGGYGKKKVYLHIASLDFEDYVKKFEALRKLFGEGLLRTEVLHWKKTRLLNRYPLEYLVEK